MKRLCLLLLPLLLLLIVGCQQESPDLLYRRANELAQRGDNASLAQASKWLSEAIDQGNPRQEVLELKALCDLRTSDYSKAQKAALAAVKAYPDSFVGNYVAGKVAYDQGDDAGAKPFLEKACALKPQDANANLLLALVAGHLKLPEADTYFKQLTNFGAFSSDSLVYNEWGTYYAQTNRPYDAIGVLSAAMQFSDAKPVVFLNAAIIYDRNLHKPLLAKRFYKKYLLHVAKTDSPTMDQVKKRLVQLSSG